MKRISPAMHAMFAEFQAGRKKGLEDFLRLERPYIYDYLMRMTGQVTLSASTTAEVTEQIIAITEPTQDLPLVMLNTYKLAKFLTSKDWNADTSRLESNAPIERKLRAMIPQRREVLLLRYRLEFPVSEVATLMEISDEETAILLNEALNELGTVDQPQSTIATLQFFELPEDEPIVTQNLSEVIREIKTTSRSLPSGIFKKIFVMGVVLIVMFLVYQILANFFHFGKF